MTEIIRYKNINLDKINYTKPTNQQNAYFGSIDYNEKSFNIQTSNLKIVEIKDKSIKVSVDENDFSFYDMLVKLDDHNLSSTYKQSKEWFQKELPMDVLETMYKRLSKPFKKDTVPIIEFKFHPKQKCQVYDQSNKQIELSELSDKTNIIGIISVKGLKFLKRDYYCECYLSQIKLSQPETPKLPYGCLIEDEEPSKYDYEIFDEEVIQNSTFKIELQQQIKSMEKTIQNDQKQLQSLQEKLKSFN
jgi:hypothetical protein